LAIFSQIVEGIQEQEWFTKQLASDRKKNSGEHLPFPDSIDEILLQKKCNGAT
jgi:hypothetical protein